MKAASPRRLLRPSIWDYHIARRVYGHLIRNRKLQLRKRGLGSKQYLNVGCGGNAHSDFINLDYRWHPKIDLCWDITRGIPLRAASLQGIYTEHCLEHIPFTPAFSVLKEFRRMLRPGGTVRVVVPDGELYLDLYQKSKSDPGAAFPGVPDPRSASANGVTPMLVVNRAFRAFGHCFVYDYATMELLLARAGFADIRRAGYRQGRDEAMLIDYEKRAANSLYAEASVVEECPSASDVAALGRFLEGAAPPSDLRDR